jgi:nitronate monooxygenase
MRASRWKNSQLAARLSITVPLIQAPMAGGYTTPALVAAVSNAGGLGSLGAGYQTPEAIANDIAQIKQMTHKPFAVNLFVPGEARASQAQQQKMTRILNKVCAELAIKTQTVTPPYLPSFDEQLAVVLENEVPIFSFTFGIPTKTALKKLKQKNIITMGTATSLAEAKKLKASGIDIIVAQGAEAGGHRGTFIGEVADNLRGNFTLIPQLVDEVDLPIVAAGGIMDARGIVAALLLGAQAVQLGTAFLTTTEAGTHSKVKQLLLNLTDDKTVLTKTFSGKYARGINNKFIKKMAEHKSSVLDYPIQNKMTAEIRKLAAKRGKTDFMSMWAGQAAYLCQDVSAAHLMQMLINDVDELLRSVHDKISFLHGTQ